mgnify:CR=1 FL=1
MVQLSERSWVPGEAEKWVQAMAARVSTTGADGIDERLHGLVERNRHIHEVETLNLNPATNTMNPRAEALLSAGLGSRPSLGYPGQKCEMGLEAIEEIEVMAAELAAEVFGATHAEVRVPSGALANLYAFLATTDPGDAIIAPPPEIGGHVTHHRDGAAGLHRLEVHAAPVDAARYSVDIDRLREQAHRVRPKLITIGGSLNLAHHPVGSIRSIADEVGAKVLFDAAHLSGPIAGGTWPSPLAEGAHLMTMSTYKSLGGPPAGLLLTNEAEIAERVDAIAYPGLTANFDVGKTAALVITLLDWKSHGHSYAREMTKSAQTLATALAARDVAVHGVDRVWTKSHAFALDARTFGGGHELALRLRRANLLASAIGLPTDTSEATGGGLRIGLNEAVRWGMRSTDMAELADLVARAVHDDPDSVAEDVTALRSRFDTLAFVR